MVRFGAMEPEPVTRRFPRAAELIVVGTAFAIGLAVRLWNLPGMGLWYDELISVTLADRPYPAWLYSALVYEPHPPLFTLLLHIWLRLGRGDTLILLFPVLAGAAAIPALYLAFRHALGPRAAAAGALLLAVHPLALYWSHHARMYAPLMLFVSLALGANLLYLRRPGRLPGVSLVAAQQAVIWVHIAGWFCVACLIAMAEIEARRRAWPTRGWRRMQLISLGLGLPALLFPLLRGGLGHMLRPGLAEIAGALAQQVRGPMPATAPVMGLAAAVSGGAVILLLLRARTRSLALALLILPLLAAIVLSHTLRPMWYSPRTFAFMTPFWCAGIGALMFSRGSETTRWAPRLLAALALLLQLQGSLSYLRDHRKRETYADVARHLRLSGLPGDRVVVRAPHVAWGLNWYLLGPDWDDGLLTELRGASPGARDGRGGLVALYEAVKDFDRRPHGTTISVETAEGREVALRPGERAWILARDDDQHADLVARLHLAGETSRTQHYPGLILSLFTVPDRAGPSTLRESVAGDREQRSIDLAADGVPGFPARPPSGDVIHQPWMTPRGSDTLQEISRLPEGTRPVVSSCMASMPTFHAE
jgi:hypothetical protein